MTDAPPLDVSRLGFGTAALGRSLSRAERLRLLETAYDCGIRYFDTAPLYGGGAAEEALGRFLRGGRRDDVVVATKVGIEPVTLLRAGLSRLTGRPAAARGGCFAPDQVRASLARSLRRLSRDRVDVLLLHEVRAPDLGHDLAEALRDAIARGEIGDAGIATSAAETEAVLAVSPPFVSVVQLAVSLPLPEIGDRRLVLHSAIAGRPGDPGTLLRQAVANAPRAQLLFGSRNPPHIRETIRGAAEEGR